MTVVTDNTCSITGVDAVSMTTNVDVTCSITGTDVTIATSVEFMNCVATSIRTSRWALWWRAVVTCIFTLDYSCLKNCRGRRSRRRATLQLVTTCDAPTCYMTSIARDSVKFKSKDQSEEKFLKWFDYVWKISISNKCWGVPGSDWRSISTDYRKDTKLVRCRKIFNRSHDCK